MSKRISNYGKKTTVTNNNRCCLHCKNIGKSEQEYRSHWIRESPDSSAKVVCPELLKASCNYCGTLGHLVSYCQVLKKDNKEKYKIEKNEKSFKKRSEIQQPVLDSKKMISRNSIFTAIQDLDEDTASSDSDSHDYPALSVKSESLTRNIQPTVSITSYASILKTEVITTQEVPIQNCNFRIITKVKPNVSVKQNGEKQPSTKLAIINGKQQRIVNFFADSDSDSEDDN